MSLLYQPQSQNKSAFIFIALSVVGLILWCLNILARHFKNVAGLSLTNTFSLPERFFLHNLIIPQLIYNPRNMPARLWLLFLLSQLCLSETIPAHIHNNTQQDIRKRSLGLFDKGSSWTSPDGLVTLAVPAAHFCGTETLKNVARRSNPQKYGDTSLNAYHSDLQKADIVTRRSMVRNTALRIAGTISPACDATFGGQLGRQLLTTQPANRMPISLMTFKAQALVMGQLGVSMFWSSLKNSTTVTEDVIAVMGIVVTNMVMFTAIDTMLHPFEPAALDPFRAAAVVLNLLAVEEAITYFNRFLVSGCPVTQPGDRFQATLAMSDWNAKDSNIRPVSDVDQINKAPNKEACPSNPVEAGVSGEVVG